LLPGFLGSARAVAITGMFTLIFTAMIGGIISAVSYHRQAVQRAGAIERLRAELAEAELRALRAQVNPHFLFNALNTIAALVREQPAQAEETITQLAEVFRYTLRASDREHGRLGDELEFLRAYLNIERVRFGSRLAVQEHIEPGLESLLVPSLLLQPVVENAVLHGIAERTTGGTVSLSVRRDGERLILEIEDDGPGFDGRSSRSGNGFGLHSVRERLRGAGPPHDLAIESVPGRGTRVRITLPARLTPGPTRSGERP
jgi:LytS/YehU family sensor histidine kinase